ncbi:MAG TPA: TetR family transcriptional regulator [Micromonosporaceae bacterium]|jgi:AcrR family transcriptional regulator|nr:TetR family transcriptional regulator [Micromonosporaceae bacterium]
MAVPYESTGRREQKGRTRAAILAAAREQLAGGITPTVESAAAEADVSRTTAYRYFPTQRQLLQAAYPEIEAPTLLPRDATADPVERLDLVVRALARINDEWEPHLRTALRLSLEQPATGESPIMRRGRAIGWLTDALEPLRDSRSDIDVRALALAIRSATGIEAKIWLTDVANLSGADAAALASWVAQAMLAHALAGHPLPTIASARTKAN